MKVALIPRHFEGEDKQLARLEKKFRILRHLPVFVVESLISWS